MSSIQRKEKYDVFISFRGQDTRRTFTSHLHAALIRRKVETFIDYRIERGDEVEAVLLKAIDESKISVVILSLNYASSKWCLDELAYILERKKGNEHYVVIPIFYQIDPAVVRYQKDSFATAFAKHEEREENMMKVLTWKHALRKIADLSAGSSSSTVRDDAQLVEEVVEDILKKLNHEPLCDLTGLVGVESRIQQVLFLLEPEDVRVRFLVMWGMGGIGKTTLADIVFQGLCSQFEASCFLANLRERSGANGAFSPQLYQLRDELLQELLGDKSLTNKTQTLQHWVKVRLQRTKVLVVLDDVNDRRQLEFLAGDQVPFGPGSRILITTRDLKRATEMQVVRKGTDHSVKIYNFQKLNSDESLQVFHSNAFRKICPQADLTRTLTQVIDSAAGIPLALNIWHSLFLQCKSIEELDNIWIKMKKYPSKELQNVYRVSYDVLEENEREIFLDIACFHKGKNLPEAKRLLDACGFFSDNGIKCLIDMSLISIKDECLWMHDVIQEMGWKIVSEECPEEPGNRSRLYTCEDIRHVFEKNTGTAKVQGISLPFHHGRVKLSTKAFNNMHRLRFLLLDGRVGDSDCEPYLESLPDALGYVKWVNCPIKYLPLSFSPHKLVELDMHNSQLQSLWSEEKNPQILKRIQLTASNQLVEISGLSKCTNIESINLSGCSSLLQVPSSFQNMTSLTYLNLAYCSKIKSLPDMPSKMEILDLGCTGIERLPSSIFESRNVKRLKLYGCSRLKQIPEIVEPMECLEFLDLRETGIQELPSSFGNLIGLKELKLDQCSNLQVVYNLKHLENLSFAPNEYSSVSSELEKLPPSSVILCPLISLELYGCCLLEEIPDALITLTSLQHLDLRGTKIQIMPPMEKVSGLRSLVLGGCERLQSLTELPCLLQRLYVNGCTSLKTVSFSMTALEQGLDHIISHRVDVPDHDDSKESHGFNGCLNLDEKARCNIMNDAQLRILRMATAYKLEFQDRPPQDQTYAIKVVCPGNEIPKWFSCQAEGSSINIKLPLNWAHEANFLGFAFCILLKTPMMKPGIAYNPNWRCYYELIFNINGGETCQYDLSFTIASKRVSSDHFNLLVWYEAIQLLDAWKLSTEVFIDFRASRSNTVDDNTWKTSVERCGACFLYDQGQENVNSETCAEVESSGRRKKSASVPILRK